MWIELPAHVCEGCQHSWLLFPHFWWPLMFLAHTPPFSGESLAVAPSFYLWGVFHQITLCYYFILQAAAQLHSIWFRLFYVHVRLSLKQTDNCNSTDDGWWRLLFEERFFLNLIPYNFEGADNDKTEMAEVSRVFRHTHVSKQNKKWMWWLKERKCF